jgi:hypothetical protein
LPSRFKDLTSLGDYLIFHGFGNMKASFAVDSLAALAQETALA